MDMPRLEETGRGNTVYAAGRYLYSNRDPSGRSERIANATPVEARCIYFVPSPLLGYGLDTLLSRVPTSSIILAIESSQELMAACSPGIDPKLLSSPRICWARLSDRTALNAVVKELGTWNFRKVRRIDLSSGASLDKAVYGDLFSFLTESLVVYWRNRHALGRLGKDWIRHSLANIVLIKKKEVELLPFDDRTDKRIQVVIGAGPSLEDAIPFLRDNRENLRLLCTDTAVSTLTESGLQPDAIIALETQAWNMLDFHGLADSGIPVYADLTSYPPSLKATGGPVHMFSSQFADLVFLDRIEAAGLRPSVIPPLGSVGLSALEIALNISDSPVLLTGLDFSYRPGKSHARGSSVHRWQLTNSRRVDPVPGWEASMKRPRMSMRGGDGCKVSSDAILAGYAAQLADRYAGNDRLFVLAPGGLDLGLPVMEREVAEDLLKSWSTMISESLSYSGTDVNENRDERLVPSSYDAELFLNEEKQRLGKIIDSWNDYAKGRSTAAVVSENLTDMDEIFCDFPDEPPLPNTEDSFLVRAVSRARKLLHYLNRLV